MGENEVIQTSSLILTCFQLCMTGPLPSALRFKIVRLLLLPKAIAEEIHCHLVIVYRIQKNLFMYNSPFRTQFRPKETLRPAGVGL